MANKDILMDDCPTLRQPQAKLYILHISPPEAIIKPADLKEILSSYSADLGRKIVAIPAGSSQGIMIFQGIISRCHPLSERTFFRKTDYRRQIIFLFKRLID